LSAPKEIEIGTKFNPRYDKQGLIPAIAQDAGTGEVLMVAFMNEQALMETIATGNAVYYSRSRKKKCGQAADTRPGPGTRPCPKGQ